MTIPVPQAQKADAGSGGGAVVDRQSGGLRGSDQRYFPFRFFLIFLIFFITFIRFFIIFFSIFCVRFYLIFLSFYFRNLMFIRFFI